MFILNTALWKCYIYATGLEMVGIVGLSDLNVLTVTSTEQ